MVVVATQGGCGEPRPAVVVRTDALSVGRGSVILCQMTSDIRDEIGCRPVVRPDGRDRLERRSQVMADKLVTVRRERVGQVVGQVVGRVGPEAMRELDRALVLTLGIAEPCGS